ncbi:hypothetical protein [Streptomyces shaanxiensis]
MGEAGRAAQAVVAQYVRDGFLTPESVARAEFDVWDRTTPGRVLLVAVQVVLALRQEDGRTDLGRPVPGLDAEDAELMIRTLLRDPAAAPETSRRDLITLDRLLELLASLIAEESLSEEEVEALLEAAEEGCLAVGHWPRSPGHVCRGGPWQRSGRAPRRRPRWRTPYRMPVRTPRRRIPRSWAPARRPARRIPRSSAPVRTPRRRTPHPPLRRPPPSRTRPPARAPAPPSHRPLRLRPAPPEKTGARLSGADHRPPMP